MDKEELCKTTDEEKKISVIIPCHNAELTIDRCMESVEKQTIGEIGRASCRERV